MQLNRWHHVAGTYDGFWLRLYIDSVEVASEFQFGGLPTIWPEAPFYVGAQYGYMRDALKEERCWPGYIDDVRLYNYALTATEAAQLYLEVEGGSSCPEDPIYDFNGDCETTMVDFAMFMEGWMECNLIQCY